MQGELPSLPSLLNAADASRFDAIVGNNALLDAVDKQAAIALIAGLLAEDGVISLAERVPRHTQRLYALADLSSLGPDVRDRVEAAEEAIYLNADDPLVNWDVTDLETYFAAAGFSASLELVAETTQVQVTEVLLQRWFAESNDGRPTYAQRLAIHLTSSEIGQVHELFVAQLCNRAVAWSTCTVYLVAGPRPAA